MSYKIMPKLLITLISGCISLFIAIASSSLPAVADDLLLPELGSASGGIMTPAQEKRLGQAFMRSVKASQKIIDEAFARTYIEQLGHKLSRATDQDTLSDFDFFIIDNPQINAFAGPGGHIGVYSGLILTSQSESELAAVVAHEIAHVTQKHLMRTFHQASQMSLPSAAVLLASVILGAAAGGEAGVAAAMAGQAALIQNQINFTRANEKEADRVGISTLANAEFDPHAMPTFFERMGRANRTYSSELPEFLRTHPVTTNRIADSVDRADQHPYQQHEDSLHYFLVKALIRQRAFANPKEAEKYFSTNLKEGRHRNAAGQRFGLALSLIAQNRYQDAGEQIKTLLKSHPTEPVFMIYDSRIDAASGNLKRAIKNLENSLLLYAANYPLNLQLAELYIQARDYSKAISLLKDTTVLRPFDDTVYKRLAEAYGQNQQLVEAHNAQSDYLYLNGQLEPAIQQLEIALRQDNVDFYLASKLEAKLAALKNELAIIEANKK